MFVNIICILLFIIIINTFKKKNIDRYVSFEDVYERILDYCLQFNKETNDGFLHIHGGCSIKYHLNKKNISSNLMTKDFDIVIVPINKKPNSKQNLFKKFIYGLKYNFPYFNWSYDIFNNFISPNIHLDSIHLNIIPEIIRIKLNGVYIIDISYYDYLDEIPVFNFFNNAIKKLYNINLSEYYKRLIMLHSLKNQNYINLEKITFANLEIGRQTIFYRLYKQNYLLKNINLKFIEKSIILHEQLYKETDINKIILYEKMIQYLIILHNTYAYKQQDIYKLIAKDNFKLSLINKII